MSVVHDIDDRELHAGDPAEPDQNDQQESVAHQPVGEPKARQGCLEHEDQGEHRQEHGKNRNIDPAVVPGLDPRRDQWWLGLQGHLKIADLTVSDTRLIGDGRLGATLAARIIKARESLQVRDLVVEPERERHRRGARAIDQDFQPPRLQGVEARIDRQREQPGILLPLDALGERVQKLVVVLHEAESLPVLNDAQAIEAIALGLPKVFVCRENRKDRWRRRRSPGRRSASGACNPRNSACRPDCRRWRLA